MTIPDHAKANFHTLLRAAADGIAWKVRFFIPASDDGQAVLSRLLERHRIVDVAGRG